MTTYDTLLLDQTEWDLVVDSAGNIAMGSPAYALAQDVASAIKLFLGELWYDTTKGIPYFEDILGQAPPSSLITANMEQAAMTVPGVVSAQCTITSFNDRELNGIVLFIDENGVQNGVSF
jgi:hypothetical protein